MTNSRTYIRSFQKILFENYVFTTLNKIFGIRIYKPDSLVQKIEKEKIIQSDNLEFLNERKIKINFFE